MGTPTSDNNTDQVSFIQYLQLVVVAMRENPEWRPGQAYYNVLETVRPDIAANIIKNHRQLDPYYDPDCIPQFLVFALDKW